MSRKHEIAARLIKALVLRDAPAGVRTGEWDVAGIRAILEANFPPALSSVEILDFLIEHPGHYRLFRKKWGLSVVLTAECWTIDALKKLREGWGEQ